MKRTTRSILQELHDIQAKPEPENVVDSRAVHVIESAINVIAMMHENFDNATANDLKRFTNSIKSMIPEICCGIKNIKGVSPMQFRELIAEEAQTE